jgi:hypothetical protein
MRGLLPGLLVATCCQSAVNLLATAIKCPASASTRCTTQYPAPPCLPTQVLWRDHRDRIHRLPFCWLFGHPWSLLDQPFVAHMPGVWVLG